MAAITAGISQSFAFEDNTGVHLRVASFASYLSNDDDVFTLKLGESSRSLNPVLSPDPLYQLSLNPSVSLSPDPLYQVNLNPHLSKSPEPAQESKYNQASELGVFDAEKYFSQETYGEKTDIPEKGGSRSLSREERNRPPKTTPIKSSTPSIRSESSWNSQSALLSSLRRDPSANSRKQANGKRFFAGFGYCGYCSGKRSVDISDTAGNNVRDSTGSKRIVHLEQLRSVDAPADYFGRNLGVFVGRNRQNPPEREEMRHGEIDKMGVVGFSREAQARLAFPISNPVAGDLTVGGGPLDADEIARFSLEVFGAKDNLSATLKKKLSRLSLNNGRRNVANIPVGPTGGAMMDGRDDAASDASSDLFEIGSLSPGAAHPFFQLGPSEDASAWAGAGAGACYEPSEASIEWSVVTASAANFSVPSDDERLLMDHKNNFKERDQAMIMAATRTPPKSKSPAAKSPSPKQTRQRPAGSLLGCKSDEAVKVAADECQNIPALKADPRSRRQSESITHLARLQAQAQAQVIPSPMASELHRRRLSESMAPLARLEGDALVMDFESAQLSLGGRSLSFSPRALYMH
ncbi:hypothetical protein ACLOJK_029061 [Asimina triloba]